MASSTAVLANAPMPFDIRAGHNVIYVDWKDSVLPTDSVKVTTPDGTKLGVVAALAGQTQQLQLPSDKAISTVVVDYKGVIHTVSLSHGMGSGQNH